MHVCVYIYIYVCVYIHIYIYIYIERERMYICFPGNDSGKESTCQIRRCKRWGFNIWVGENPWSR